MDPPQWKCSVQLWVLEPLWDLLDFLIKIFGFWILKMIVFTFVIIFWKQKGKILHILLVRYFVVCSRAVKKELISGCVWVSEQCTAKIIMDKSTKLRGDRASNYCARNFPFQSTVQISVCSAPSVGEKLAVCETTWLQCKFDLDHQVTHARTSPNTNVLVVCVRVGGGGGGP